MFKNARMQLLKEAFLRPGEKDGSLGVFLQQIDFFDAIIIDRPTDFITNSEQLQLMTRTNKTNNCPSFSKVAPIKSP